MRRALPTLFAVFAAVVGSANVAATSGEPLLLRTPTVSATSVVFAYADDLWIVGRDGGAARRLTTGVGIESHPLFSPDGKTVAFSGEYYGNIDLYVVAASGGEPRRRTWHPGDDELLSWSADGANLLFAFFGTIALVWVQAFAEELGWRGYFLPRAMERFGHWPGLVLHGAVWGLWYAPVLLFATAGPLEFASFVRPLAFVVTCALLGTLYGWLRLASGSLAPVVVTNTTLTLAAGLPYVIHGVDPGLRSAAFGASGWLVLVVAIGALTLTRWRSVVRLPIALGDGPVTVVGFLMRRSPGRQFLN